MRWNRELKIKLRQLNIYEDTPARMKYTVFPYTFIRPLSALKGMNGEQIFKVLSRHIGFMLDIPISVIQKMATENGRPHKYMSFDYSNSWPETARFSSTGMKALMANTAATLVEMGVDPARYRVIKRTFPSGAMINDVGITPFPILIIKDRLFDRSYADKIVPF